MATSQRRKKQKTRKQKPAVFHPCFSRQYGREQSRWTQLISQEPPQLIPWSHQRLSVCPQSVAAPGAYTATRSDFCQMCFTFKCLFSLYKVRMSVHGYMCISISIFIALLLSVKSHPQSPQFCTVSGFSSRWFSSDSKSHRSVPWGQKLLLSV